MSSEASGSGSLLEEFFVRLGVKPDLEGLKKFQNSLGGVRKAMEAMGVFAVVDLGSRLLRFVEGAVGASAQIQMLSEITRISTTVINAFNEAALENSVSTGEMMGGLEGVTRAAGAAAAGFTRYKAIFDMLGVDPKGKTPLQMFDELSAKFAEMDPGERAAIASRLGISAKLAQVMGEDGEEFMRAVNEFHKNPIMTEADYKAADKVEISILRLRKTIQQVTTLIAVELGPAIDRVLKAFNDWWQANRQIAMTKLGDWIWIVIYYMGVLWGWTHKVLGVVGDLWNELTFGLLPGFKGVVAAVVALEGIKLAVWIHGVVAALRGLMPVLGLVGLAIAGTMAWISVGKELTDNWGVIVLWLRDLWRDVVEAVKDAGAAILKIPGVKRIVNWMWADTEKPSSGRAADEFLAQRAQKKADEEKAKARYAPDALRADGVGIWRVREDLGATLAAIRAGQVNTSTVTIGTVQIAADKGREATVGAQLQEQIRKASAARNAQGPFKS